MCLWEKQGRGYKIAWKQKNKNKKQMQKGTVWGWLNSCKIYNDPVFSNLQYLIKIYESCHWLFLKGPHRFPCITNHNTGKSIGMDSEKRKPGLIPHPDWPALGQEGYRTLVQYVMENIYICIEVKDLMTCSHCPVGSYIQIFILNLYVDLHKITVERSYWQNKAFVKGWFVKVRIRQFYHLTSTRGKIP